MDINQFMKAKLESDIAIKKVEIKARRNYCLNNVQIVEAMIQDEILKEMERQLIERRKHQSGYNG